MRLYLFVIVAVLTAAPLVAQGPAPVGLRQPTAITSSGSRTASFATAAAPETQWKKGMLIGAVAGLGLYYLAWGLFNGSCETSSCRPNARGFLISIALFGMVGGMIGSSLPKR